MVDNRPDETMDDMEGKLPKFTKNFFSKMLAIFCKSAIILTVRDSNHDRPTQTKEEEQT